MTKIYYVARQATIHFKLHPRFHGHTTLIYSRKWFPYKPDNLSEPLFATRDLELDNFAGQPVIRFAQNTFEWRHRQFKVAGATWDYPDFKPHITLKGDWIFHAEHPQFEPLLVELKEEYYMTWDEPRRRKSRS